ncbi:hypothetical protein [Sandaracinus amylolyticus]|uniref:hypothetical protein n=1 Tax=Sandaracinus amylolyticus TaxID=927083 RepID=UPI001F3B71A9|nr:hypothetical protein [Sandaracinus amylolyticus]UJR80303.1 Hypothetical protein I5071_23470 [Sandaracinus amylolyticus]
MRTTHRLWLSALIVALGATSALASPAHAQNMSVRFTEQFGGRELMTLLYETPEATGQPLSLEECTDNIAIPLEITNVPTGTTQIDVWFGSSADADCPTASVRADTTNTSCEYVTTFSAMVPTTEIDALVSQLFGADACDTSADRTFFFFASTTAQNTSKDFTAAETATFRIALDVDPPGAPTIDGGPFEGDQTIEITYDLPEGTLVGANVYVDPAGCTAEGEIDPAGSLQDGAEPPSTGGDLQRGETATVDASDIEYNTFAAVGITAVDQARNESTLVVTCVRRVEIEGALSSYCRSKGFDDMEECLAEYECSVPGAGLGGRARATMIVLLGAALLVLARRNRRS